MAFSKGNVFTALDADNVAVGTRVLVANNLDELKHKVSAYEDEQEIAEPATVIDIQDECMCHRFKVQFDGVDRVYDYAMVYVIPQTIRPFNDLAELVNYWDKHYQKEKRPPYTLPFMWVVSDRGTHLLITGFRKEDNTVDLGKEWHSLQYMFDNFKFEDGRPFGVVIK